MLDDSGGVLPGVTVGLIESPPRRAITDEQGRFRFAGLPPRVYTLTAELRGFTTLQQAVEVRAGAVAELTLAMRVGALQETITVTGTSPTISASTASVSRGRRDDRREGITPPANRESYDQVEDNRFHRAAKTPLSTFSIDVDTAGYSNVRRFLNDGELPPRDAVRIEELINYFRYDYPAPVGDVPFSVTTELAACPWNVGTARPHRIARSNHPGRRAAGPQPGVPHRRLGVDERAGQAAARPSWPAAARSRAHRQDRVAIVVYAGSSGLVLPSTPGDRREVIDAAIANLAAGGSTNGAEGIQLAYRTARRELHPGGINRVILGHRRRLQRRRHQPATSSGS